MWTMRKNRVGQAGQQYSAFSRSSGETAARHAVARLILYPSPFQQPQVLDAQRHACLSSRLGGGLCYAYSCGFRFAFAKSSMMVDFGLHIAEGFTQWCFVSMGSWRSKARCYWSDQRHSHFSMTTNSGYSCPSAVSCIATEQCNCARRPKTEHQGAR
jgi:hypothetical protein